LDIFELDVKNRKINKIVVVGGGTAGNITIASLINSRAYEMCDIHQIIPEDKPSLTVGESTTPHLIGMLCNGAFTTFSELVQKLKPVFKLGTMYDFAGGKPYVLPFEHDGLVGGKYRLEKPMCWYLDELSKEVPDPTEILIESRKTPFRTLNNEVYCDIPFGLHFERDAFDKFMNDTILTHNVTIHRGAVLKTTLSSDFYVKSVKLSSGETVDGDLFIDCTGASSVLIGKALDIPIVDISDEILCNSALVTRHSSKTDPLPCTSAEQMDYGWLWQIDQSSGFSNRGYVFSDKFATECQARENLDKKLKGMDYTEPFLVNWKPGYRKDIWSRNVIALGSSAGFSEPMEASAIYLQCRVLDAIRTVIENSQFMPGYADVEYVSDYWVGIFETTKEYIKLRYACSEPLGTEFWQASKNIAMSQGAQNFIRKWHLHGSQITPKRIDLPNDVYGFYLWERTLRASVESMSISRLDESDIEQYKDLEVNTRASLSGHLNIEQAYEFFETNFIQNPLQ
jgi:tryptophan halogenase